jgi:uncharacterized protein DUF6235
MSHSIESHGTAGPRFRLDAGLDLLEKWAETANQSRKNAVYKALFAVTDGSVFANYIVFEDRDQARAFSVMIKEDLIMSITIEDVDSFAVRYVGPLGAVQSVDLDINPTV